MKDTQNLNSDPNDPLNIIRAVINGLIPDFIEKIKYGIPTVVYKGKNLIHFAKFKEHIGIYPGPEAIKAFEDELKEYALSKGTIKIPNSADIPVDLIKKLVQYRINVIDQK